MSKVGLLAPQGLLPCGKMVLKPPAQVLHSPGGRAVLQVTWALTGVSEVLQSRFAALAEPLHHQDISRVELLTVRLGKGLLEKESWFIGQGGEDTEKVQARVAKR